MRRIMSAKAYEDEIILNIVALIDVCFLLLSFLLLSSNFRVAEGELESTLPKYGGPAGKVAVAPPETPEVRVTLRVSQGGPEASPSVLIDGIGPAVASGSGGMVWLEQELARLGTYKKIREDGVVILEAEPHLAYRWVIKALDLCRQARFSKVEFAASKRNNPYEGPAPPKTPPSPPSPP